MLITKLKSHRELIIDSFRDAMEFKAFTDLSYMFATKYTKNPGNNQKIILGHSNYGSTIGLTDQEVKLSDLPDYFFSAKNKYFLSLVHQQQVSLFEHLFFDLIRILLLDRPERLSKKKQIDYETIFNSDTKEDLIWKLIDRELNEIKYKNVSEWFDYLNKIVDLPKIDAEDLNKVAEAKATRDILVHNAGITNQTYLNKSGSAARFTIDQKLDVNGDYTLDVWKLFVELLIAVIDAIIQKFDKEHV